MPNPKSKGETRLERMEKWFRNEPLFSIVILLATIVAGAAEAVQHGSDLLVAVGLKQEKTLELARDRAKAEFSRRLVEAAWRRVFWTRNFVRRVELARPPTELDYSWNKYLDSVADWSADMVNINGARTILPRHQQAIPVRRGPEEVPRSRRCAGHSPVVGTGLIGANDSARQIPD